MFLYWHTPKLEWWVLCRNVQASELYFDIVVAYINCINVMIQASLEGSKQAT